ncbi:uncharacterized protein [Watersipora subatra]|uniref:uncharacterized protein n=1 Tax=Watersipora subatra TaxID=2589382 RepID=UPI00355C3C60
MKSYSWNAKRIVLTVIGISLLVQFGRAQKFKLGSSCLFSLQPEQAETTLACGNQQTVDIVVVWVGQSSNFSCLADSCSYARITDKNNEYYKSLISSCQSASKCQLSSRLLNDLSNEGAFSSCGVAHRVRNTVRVVYRCNSAAPSRPKTTVIPPSTVQTSITQTSVTKPPTTVSTEGTTTTISILSSNSTELAKPTILAKLQDDSSKSNERHMVVIVAPVLGFLTLASLVVLVICLKFKSRALEPKLSKKLNHRKPLCISTVRAPEQRYYRQPTVGFCCPHPHASSSDFWLNSPKTNSPRTTVQDSSSGVCMASADRKSQQSETLPDDGFYDTVSDDIYSMAESAEVYAELHYEVPIKLRRDHQTVPSANGMVKDESSIENLQNEERMKGADKDDGCVYYAAEPVTRNPTAPLDEPVSGEQAALPDEPVTKDLTASTGEPVSRAPAAPPGEPVIEAPASPPDEPVMYSNDLYEDMATLQAELKEGLV